MTHLALKSSFPTTAAIAVQSAFSLFPHIIPPAATAAAAVKAAENLMPREISLLVSKLPLDEAVAADALWSDRTTAGAFRRVEMMDETARRRPTARINEAMARR